MFRRGSERRGQVLGAPAHRGERRIGIAIGQHREQARRSLGDDRVDGDVSGVVRDLDHVPAALAFRKDDSVDVGDPDQLQIVLDEFASDRVDPNPPLRAARAARERLEDLARSGLLRWNDAVLEVEDDRVGFAVEGLFDLSLAVGGDDHPASRSHDGFFIRRAVRVHSHTSSPLWLKRHWDATCSPGHRCIRWSAAGCRRRRPGSGT